MLSACGIGSWGVSTSHQHELACVKLVQSSSKSSELSTIFRRRMNGVSQTERLTISRPDDWHLHLRDGDVLPSIVPHSASTNGREIIMTNLKPPVTTVAAAKAYQDRIMAALPTNSEFKALMTLYLTESTTRDEIKSARLALVAAVTSGSKQYFLGTDSAPHARHTEETSCGCAGIYSSPIALPLYTQVFEQAGALDKLEAFASFNGPRFYELPINTTTVTLASTVGSRTVVPLYAGETLDWTLEQE